MSLRFRLKSFAERLAAMNTEFQFRLLDLPNELIAHIIEHVESVKALRKLVRTCHRIRDLAEPVLYRSVLVRSGELAEKVVRSIESRRARAAGIHYLDVPCDCHADQNFNAVSTLMRRARNLKTLMIESPECNNGDFEDEGHWQQMANCIFRPLENAVDFLDATEPSTRPLQNLRELTLHLNGSDSPYWTISGSSVAIFQHPTLRYLKISCVNVLDCLASQLQSKARTPLKHLELEECNITHIGLQSVLSLPEALETLYLGENIHNVRHFVSEIDQSSNHLFQTDVAATMRALQQQEGSLESLAYVTTESYYQHKQLARQINADRSSADAGFANFYRLRHVTLSGQCPNFERALMTSRSPPNLKTVQYRGASPLRQKSTESSPLEAVPFLRAPSCSMPPGLETVDIVYETSIINFAGLQSAKKGLMQSAAMGTEKIGIRMRVFYCATTGFFPPYLYGEPRPKDELIFTGYRDGFVGRLLKPRHAVSSADDEATTSSEWEDTDTASSEEED